MKVKRFLPVLILLLSFACLGWFYFTFWQPVLAPILGAKIQPRTNPPTPTLISTGAKVETPKVAAVPAGAKPEAQAEAVSPPIEATGPGDMFNTPSHTDLGTVEFTDGVPVKFDLINGGSCEIRPTVLEGGQLELVFILVVQKPDTGKIEAAAPRITTRPGSHVSIGISSLSVSVTPTLKGM